MSSCGLLLVFIYSSAAVFMIVDGQTTSGDTVDISLILQRALNAVEALKAKVAKMSARIKHLEIQGPPGVAGKVVLHLTVCLAVNETSDVI